MPRSAKENSIPVDRQFGLVGNLGHQLPKPGSPRQFLVASGHQATTK